MELIPSGNKPAHETYNTDTPNSLGTPRSKFSRLLKKIKSLALPIFAAAALYLSPQTNAGEIYNEVHKVKLMGTMNSNVSKATPITRNLAVVAQLKENSATENPSDYFLNLKYRISGEPKFKNSVIKIPPHLKTYINYQLHFLGIAHPPAVIISPPTNETIFSETYKGNKATSLSQSSKMSEIEFTIAKSILDKTLNKAHPLAKTTFHKLVKWEKNKYQKFWQQEATTINPNWQLTQIPIYRLARLTEKENPGVEKGRSFTIPISADNGKTLEGKLILKLDLSQNDLCGSINFTIPLSEETKIKKDQERLWINNQHYGEYPAALVSLDQGKVIPLPKEGMLPKKILADLWIEPCDPEIGIINSKNENEIGIKKLGGKVSILEIPKANYESIKGPNLETLLSSKADGIRNPEKGTSFLVRSSENQIYKVRIIGITPERTQKGRESSMALEFSKLESSLIPLNITLPPENTTAKNFLICPGESPAGSRLASRKEALEMLGIETNPGRSEIPKESSDKYRAAAYYKLKSGTDMIIFKQGLRNTYETLKEIKSYNQRWMDDDLMAILLNGQNALYVKIDGKKATSKDIQSMGLPISAIRKEFAPEHFAINPLIKKLENIKLLGKEIQIEKIPTWFKGNQDQISQAKKLGIPVAKEYELGGAKMKLVLIPGNQEINPFYLSIYETTNQEYKTFYPNHTTFNIIEYVDNRGKKIFRTGTSDKDNQPATLLSVKEAEGFCEQTSLALKRKIRLPTSREWKHANKTTPRKGNFKGNLRKTFLSPKAVNPWAIDNIDFTCEGGRFNPNEFGLYDMVGNASELTSTNKNQLERVCEGSSFKDDVEYKTKTLPLDKKVRGMDVGIRIVEELTPEQLAMHPSLQQNTSISKEKGFVIPEGISRPYLICPEEVPEGSRLRTPLKYLKETQGDRQVMYSLNRSTFFKITHEHPSEIKIDTMKICLKVGKASLSAGAIFFLEDNSILTLQKSKKSSSTRETEAVKEAINRTLQKVNPPEYYVEKEVSLKDMDEKNIFKKGLEGVALALLPNEINSIMDPRKDGTQKLILNPKMDNAHLYYFAVDMDGIKERRIFINEHEYNPGNLQPRLGWTTLSPNQDGTFKPIRRYYEGEGIIIHRNSLRQGPNTIEMRIKDTTGQKRTSSVSIIKN